MKRPVQSTWIAALEIAATAIYEQDGGIEAGFADSTTGWRSQEMLNAWLAIRKEIQRLESGGAP